MHASIKPTLALLCAPLLALGLAACASSVSTAGYTGEKHAVAQTIANFQSDVREASEQKVCDNDLSSALVTRLGGSGGCRQALKKQLTEVDNPELSVQSIQLNTSAGPRTARAQVKSIYEGKNRLSTLSLVEERGKWKIAAGA
jgi:hypothetical protein